MKKINQLLINQKLVILMGCIFLLVACEDTSEEESRRTSTGTKDDDTANTPVDVSGSYLTGKVVNNVDQESLSDAKVSILNQAESIQTDDQGSFKINVPEAARKEKLTLVIQKVDGNGGLGAQIREINCLMKSDLGTIQAKPLGSIQGRAKLAEAADHTGISVYIPGTWFEAKTSKSGDYNLGLVPEGKWDLRFEREGYRHADLKGIKVISGKSTTVPNVVLFAGTGVKGSIILPEDLVLAKSLTVPITIAFSDGANLWRLSEDSSFSDQKYQTIDLEEKNKLSLSTKYTFSWWGKKILYLQLADSSGLENIVSVSFQLGAQQGVPMVEGITPTNIKRPTWNWSSGGEDGIGYYRHKLDSDNLDSNATETSETSWTPTVDLEEGSHTLYVQERDMVGNWSIAGGFTIAIIITPPGAPVVSSVSPTKQSKPFWSWVSAGNGTGNYRYRIDNSDLDTDAIATNQNSCISANDLGEGTHTLYVQERDSVGNWSLPGSAEVFVDLTAPSTPEVTGSTYTVNLRPSWTWVQGADAGIGTYRFKLDNNNFSSEITYTTAASYTAATNLSEGSHTLYVQERDLAGNWSLSGSFSVTIDLTQPVPGNSGTISLTEVSGLVPSLSWTESEDNSTVSYAVYRSTADNISTVSSAESNGTLIMSYSSGVTTYVVGGLLPKTTYYFNVLAKDQAGNKAPYSPVSFTTLDAKVAANLATSVATAQSPSRKSFFDTEHSKHWAFYYTGTGIKYSYSADGANWIAPGTQSLTSYNTNDFTVAYKAPYIFIAIQDGYSIVLRRGTLGKAAITFEDAITPQSGASTANLYKLPSLAIGSNDKINVAAFHNGAFNMYNVSVISSQNSFDGDLSSWNQAQSVGPVSNAVAGLSLMSMGA